MRVPSFVPFVQFRACSNRCGPSKLTSVRFGRALACDRSLPNLLRRKRASSFGRHGVAPPGGDSLRPRTATVGAVDAHFRLRSSSFGTPASEMRPRSSSYGHQYQRYRRQQRSLLQVSEAHTHARTHTYTHMHTHTHTHTHRVLTL